MISLSWAINAVLVLVIGAAIFALLWFLVMFVGKKLPAPFGPGLITVGQIVLIIAAVLVLIYLLVSLVGGTPVFRP